MYFKSEKVCSFYISKEHLVAILIPYIYENLKQDKKIETFFEEDLDKIFKKINLKNIFKREQFDGIDWKKLKPENLSKKFESNTEIIIICGKIDFINHINRLVLNFHTNFTLVNCYDLNELEDGIEEIMNKYSKILYTKGIEEISEFYTV